MLEKYKERILIEQYEVRTAEIPIGKAAYKTLSIPCNLSCAEHPTVFTI